MTLLDIPKPYIVLAPLAGYTDLPFRCVAKKFGADWTVSEMISSNALVHHSKKTIKMLEKCENESPYVVQIAGNDASIIKGAVEFLNDQEGIDAIDLNCGCPAPKVAGHGSGSALLKDIKKMAHIVETIKQTSNKPVTTVKIRLGFDEKNHLSIAKALQSAGADLITVHGRTRAGKFKAEVDYNAIGEVKNALTIPVIANGDIDSYEKANSVLSLTGCDGVMIGRGAIGKPWIFHQLKTADKTVSTVLKKEVILEHFDRMVDFYGDHGAVIFRKHLHTYSKGYSGASAFRQLVNSATDVDEMRSSIESFF